MIQTVVKYYVSILVLALIVMSGHGQCTFNLRTYGVQQTHFASIYLNEDGYQLSGWTWDTTGNSHPDLLLMNLSECGEIEVSNHFGESERDFFGSEDCYSNIQEIFIQVGYGLRNDTASAFVAIFDSSTDTISTFDFRSPYLGQGWEGDYFITPLSAVLTSDTLVYMSAYVFHEDTNNDIRIYCFDLQGNEHWHYDYATSYDPDQCFALYPYMYGVICGMIRGVPGSDFADLVEIIYLNESGEEEWSINEPWEVNVADVQDIIIDDGEMVLAGSVAEYADPDSLSKAALFRMSLDGDLLWYNTASDYNAYSYRWFGNVVEATDGNFVCSGNHFTVLPEFTEEDGSVNKNGWLVKFNSQTGEKMWERFYHFVVSQDDDHEIEDLKATPDGGVIFCGEATDGDTDNPDIELPIQQGWVVKVDACGCLVPGCDEECVVAIDDRDTEQPDYFKMGPNPAIQYLNVYLPLSTVQVLTKPKFALYEMNGSKITEFEASQGNCTYMLDVENYASGTYVLTLLSRDVLVQSKQVIIE